MKSPFKQQKPFFPNPKQNRCCQAYLNHSDLCIEEKTALHFAAEYGHEDAVHFLCRQLITIGEDINPRDTVSTQSYPLICCLHSLYDLLISTLGSNHEIQYDRTPLYYAAKNQHGGVVKCLVDEYQARADDNELDMVS